MVADKIMNEQQNLRTYVHQKDCIKGVVQPAYVPRLKPLKDL